MKKLLLFSILFFIFNFYANSQDFRDVSWGDSINEVKATESSEFLGKDGESLVYNTSVAGNSCVLIYQFTGNRLYSGGYMFTEKHTNDNVYIEQYQKLKELLIKKYGDPIQDRVIWKNDLYKDDRSDWGFAISLGHLIYQTSWENDETEIIHTLRGNNYEIVHGIVYTAKDLSEEAKKQEEDEALEDL